MKTLPVEEAIKRPLKSMRLAASTSFTAPEIETMLQLFERMRAGGDLARFLKSQEFSKVSRKFNNMRNTIERQRARRAAKAGT